ncbi:uncharacterized protein LOC131428952, partial [Malaya genurostris]|uniref:uncharacterized protein LOC131428952 n=1 Tax=Malaya genurostris TaxID=325434 RepID=UPI0026F3F037
HFCLTNFLNFYISANLIDNVSLWELNDKDLLEMGITEKGPRKIILSFIERQLENNVSETVTENGQNLSVNEHQKDVISAILAKEPKFLNVLTKQLNCGLIPDSKNLLFLNRILTKHFFKNKILRERRYPTWQQKQELALKILEEFPHLETTRVSENAPKESYFFWRNGGLSRGQHTGLIETRVSNMRKDVLPENRQFRRTKKETIVLKDECVQLAAFLSGLLPTPANARQISEGMIQTTDLHKLLLQKSKSNEIVSTFPHLLSYEGEMVIQAFDRIHEKNIQDTGDLKMLLRAGILFDNSSWNMIQDDFIKGALRLMKKLSNKGIKRTTGMENNASMEEITAAPIIKWIRFPHSEVGFDEMLAVKQLSSTIGDSHIICAGERYCLGNMYVIFNEYVIPCGKSSLRAIEVMFKSYAVFGLQVPALIRKLYDLISINVWGTKQHSKSKSVMADFS